MESTEKCEVVIQHFNGKYLKTPPGIPGECVGKMPALDTRTLSANAAALAPPLPPSSSAGRLDKLCTLLFLTSEAGHHGLMRLRAPSLRLLPHPRHILAILELLGQERTFLIFRLMPPCFSVQST